MTSDLKVGGFSILPTISTGIETTTNLEGDPTEKSGYIGQLLGSISASKTLEDLFINTSLSLQQQEPIDADAINSTALSGLINTNYQINDAWSIQGELEYDESIVTTTDPYQFSGNVNGVTSTESAVLGFTWTGKKYSAQVLGRIQDVATETSVTGSTASELDRVERDIRFQISRNLSDGKFYTYGGVTEIDYADSGIDRNSEGVLLGIGRSWTGKTYSITTEFGALWQRFLTDLIPINRGIVGQLEGTVALTDNWTLGAKAARSFEEQNIATNSAGLYINELSVGLQTLLHDDLLLRFGPTYTVSEFDNENFELDTYMLDATLMWQIMPNLQMPVVISYLTQEANNAALAASEFNELSLTISLVKAF
ncbi:MAG: outer membrane beta-barrel protein [Pseudomonadota bacterium]